MIMIIIIIIRKPNRKKKNYKKGKKHSENFFFFSVGVRGEDGHKTKRDKFFITFSYSSSPPPPFQIPLVFLVYIYAKKTK